MKERIKNFGNTWIPISGIIAINYLISPKMALFTAVCLVAAFIVAPLIFDTLDWSWNKLFKDKDNEDNQ